MSVEGNWNSFYTWGCGAYFQTTVEFKNDGTFQDGQGNGGTWGQRDGTLIFIYENGVAYAGNTVHGSITGMGFSKNGSISCWYATRRRTGFLAEAVAPSRAFERSSNKCTLALK